MDYNRKARADKALKDMLDDLDCEKIEEADDRLTVLSAFDEFDDLDRICSTINAGMNTTHCRIITFKNFDDVIHGIAIYTRLEFDGKDYELCIEDDYLGYQHGIEQIAEDIADYEVEASGLVLVPSKVS